MIISTVKSFDRVGVSDELAAGNLNGGRVGFRVSLLSGKQKASPESRQIRV